MSNADMAELVDALISGVSGETRADSNSVIRTIVQTKETRLSLFFVEIRIILA